MQSFCNEMGIETKIEVQVDATATEGMLQRRGLGKLRHLDVQQLWGQEAMKRGAFTLKRVISDEHTSDLGTKPLGRESLEKHISRMGYYNPECTSGHRCRSSNVHCG